MEMEIGNCKQVGWTRVSPATGVSQAGAPCRRKFANFGLVFFLEYGRDPSSPMTQLAPKFFQPVKGCGGQKFWERAASWLPTFWAIFRNYFRPCIVKFLKITYLMVYFVILCTFCEKIKDIGWFFHSYTVWTELPHFSAILGYVWPARLFHSLVC